MVNALLEKDPSARPTASDLLDPPAHSPSQLSAAAALIRTVRFDPLWFTGISPLTELEHSTAAAARASASDAAEGSADTPLEQNWDF